MNRLLIVASVIVAAAGLGAPFAPAQEESQVDCENAMAQSDMNFCANKDYEAADKELNAVYRKTVATMKDTDKDLGAINENYVGAVDALNDYRDGQCELAGFEARGGSMEPMLVSGCLADLTKKRTAELKGLTEGLGN